ncbi:MAG TPA: cupin domain-containing protein [Candidatus Acidoferrum sp.]|jgi:mannose-6-phosphate isomerase-like protein (cupin superfamily)
MRRLIVVFLTIAIGLFAQERKVDPTWLHRDVSTLHENETDLTSKACHYTPIFGEGDVESKLPNSVARFGELLVDAHGACKTIEYPHQEELFFVRDGSGLLSYGDESHPLAANDFTYVPPTVRHAVSNPSSRPLRLVIATVKIPADTPVAQPPKLVVANLDELKEQTVGGHPKSVLYKLLIGPRTGTRDRINATYTVADFFLMDFAPGGTNFPHHHETAEEIYLVLDGEGKMAAGGGMDGVEGLHPAKSGDAYYFRSNCTVGFYNQNDPHAKAHILALRVFVPMPKNPD